MFYSNEDSSTHTATLIEKQNWKLTHCPIVSGSPAAMLDGVKSGRMTDNTVFATPSHHDDMHYEYPWVQVDFRVQKVVKGIHLYR